MGAITKVLPSNFCAVQLWTKKFTVFYHLFIFLFNLKEPRVFPAYNHSHLLHPWCIFPFFSFSFSKVLPPLPIRLKPIFNCPHSVHSIFFKCVCFSPAIFTKLGTKENSGFQRRWAYIELVLTYCGQFLLFSRVAMDTNSVRRSKKCYVRVSPGDRVVLPHSKSFCD